MQQKSIYIILTRTTTVLSRLIAYITGERYTHASISLNKDLSTIYSFGRKQRYNPFIGGFCKENLDQGLFADCKSLPYAIVQIKVTQEQYDKANLLLQAYVENAKRYRYNYIGLLLAGIGKPYKCNHRFYCSEFAYDLLSQCDIIHEELPTGVHPQELMRHGKIIEQGDWKKRQNKMRTNRWPELYFTRKPLSDAG